MMIVVTCILNSHALCLLGKIVCNSSKLGIKFEMKYDLFYRVLSMYMHGIDVNELSGRDGNAFSVCGPDQREKPLQSGDAVTDVDPAETEMRNIITSTRTYLIHRQKMKEERERWSEPR